MVDITKENNYVYEYVWIPLYKRINIIVFQRLIINIDKNVAFYLHINSYLFLA